MEEMLDWDWSIEYLMKLGSLLMLLMLLGILFLIALIKMISKKNPPDDDSVAGVETP